MINDAYPITCYDQHIERRPVTVPRMDMIYDVITEPTFLHKTWTVPYHRTWQDVLDSPTVAESIEREAFIVDVRREQAALWVRSGAEVCCGMCRSPA